MQVYLRGGSSVSQGWICSDKCTCCHTEIFCTRTSIFSLTISQQSWLVCWLVAQQHASVSQGQICSHKCTCCHTETEVADQTFYLTQWQYTDNSPTSASADPVTPGAWQGGHWSANYYVIGMTWLGEIPAQVGIELWGLPFLRLTPKAQGQGDCLFWRDMCPSYHRKCYLTPTQECAYHKPIHLSAYFLIGITFKSYKLYKISVNSLYTMASAWHLQEWQLSHFLCHHLKLPHKSHTNSPAEGGQPRLFHPPLNHWYHGSFGHVLLQEIIIIIIMSVFLECLSMWNMLNCAEQVQIQKYETHAYKTLKTVGVQVIMLKHPTKHKNPHKIHILYQRTQKITPTTQTNDHTHACTHARTHTHTHTHTQWHTHTHTHTPPGYYTQKLTLAVQHRWMWKKWVLSFLLKIVKHCVFFWGIEVESSRQWVQKQRKIFSQRSQERSEKLSAMRCQEMTWHLLCHLFHFSHLADPGPSHLAGSLSVCPHHHFALSLANLATLAHPHQISNRDQTAHHYLLVGCVRW